LQKSFMTGTTFGLLVLLGFIVPAPLLIWLDRARKKAS